MLALFGSIIRFGLCMGIGLLNIGILAWLFGNGSRNGNRIAEEIIKGSLFLVGVALVFYLW